MFSVYQPISHNCCFGCECKHFPQISLIQSKAINPGSSNVLDNRKIEIGQYNTRTEKKKQNTKWKEKNAQRAIGRSPMSMNYTCH